MSGMDDRPLYIAASTPDPERKGPEEWGQALHPPLHRPITDLDEHELINTILHHPLNRYDVTNIKDMFSASARIFERVELREFSRTLSGDADMLVLPDDTPEQSTAIQVKRFVPQDGLGKMDAWQTNRMQRLFDEGVRQAEPHARCRVLAGMLYVFVLIDTRREQNAGQVHLRGSGCRFTGPC